MKVTSVLLSLSLTFSLAGFAHEQDLEFNTEREILRELKQIHAFGNAHEWNSKLEEHRLEATENDPALAPRSKSTVHLTNSSYE